MEKIMRTGIIGLGLLGASLALALRKNPAFRVLAWARGEAARQWARNHDAAEVFDELNAMVKECDCAVLCVPTQGAAGLLAQIAAQLPETATLTDIGSTKREIMDAAARFPALHFVGSHPMAGTEKSGCGNAFAGLYDNADVFIVPGDTSRPEDIARCEMLWRAAGCARLEKIGARQHDDLVADTSHVLHLLASAMTLGILDSPEPESQRRRFAGCATGFRDTTRIASSNPAMWREIMENNTEAVLAAIGRFEKRFRELKQSLIDRDFDRFEELFARGKLLRGAWLGYKRSRPARLVLCGIKHCGKSSAGRILAELLPAGFADSDEVLCELFRRKRGKPATVREIYNLLGEEEFRRLENEALKELADRPGALMTALGGGALSNPFVTEETLVKLGEIVWIDLPDAVAWERIRRGGIPPFLAQAADPEAEFIRANVRRREVFAARAAWIIRAEGADTPQQVAWKILAALA